MEVYLEVRINAEARALIFCGKTSPRRAKGTGPIPNPYDKPDKIMHMGKTLFASHKIVGSSDDSASFRRMPPTNHNVAKTNPEVMK